MTITYPRSLPITNPNRMTECWFDLQDNTSVQLSGAALLNVSQIVDPSWKGNFITPILMRTERPLWSAWRKSLRGGAKTFLAYDVRNAAPFNYPNAKVSGDVSVGWNGTAGVTALALSGLLSLSSLPANYQFRAGDRVGLEQSGFYGYYEVLEDVLANGSGVATITVAPFLHTTIFTTSALCRVFRAVCQFIVDQTTWAEQGAAEDAPISFSGVQRL